MLHDFSTAPRFSPSISSRQKPCCVGIVTPSMWRQTPFHSLYPISSYCCWCIEKAGAHFAQRSLQFFKKQCFSRDTNMDRSSMEIRDRRCPEYQDGVKQFLEFAYAHIEPGKKIRCPCLNCNNVYFHTREDVEADLYYYGIVKGYTPWVLHGEKFESSTNDDSCSESDEADEDDHDDMQEMIHEQYTAATINAWVGEDYSSNGNAVPDWEANKFMRLLKDAEQNLYPGCKNFSKLSFIVKLLHLKILNRWSSKSFTMLLELLKEALPDGETLPNSYYEAKKIIRDLGLDYMRIHACKNDCVLFWKEYANRQECPECKESRYKFDDGKQKKIPQKILRYFPLKPRLQRLFISKKTSLDMRWHKERRVDDGVLRHPADAEAWKEFDEIHSSFAQDPRNVRLGLASDGFNPFSNMSTSHSTWPVILVPYNLPPWKCMKNPFFIMSLLIPGPKSPGNDIDVYLQPLIDELKELWEDGVQTYDASTGGNFQLHAAVIWTINDFPAYGNLSGWSTKGFLACPTCNTGASSMWLKHGKKVCYLGHRRFLSTNHIWRRKKNSFNGEMEFGEAPKSLSGDDVLEQLSQLPQMKFGKAQQKERGVMRS